MMERFDISAQDLKSFGFTTLFCIVIALATMSIWGGLFGDHLAISFSYGYSAFFPHNGLHGAGRNYQNVW